MSFFFRSFPSVPKEDPLSSLTLEFGGTGRRASSKGRSSSHLSTLRGTPTEGSLEFHDCVAIRLLLPFCVTFFGVDFELLNSQRGSCTLFSSPALDSLKTLDDDDAFGFRSAFVFRLSSATLKARFVRSLDSYLMLVETNISALYAAQVEG